MTTDDLSGRGRVVKLWQYLRPADMAVMCLLCDAYDWGSEHSLESMKWHHPTCPMYANSAVFADWSKEYTEFGERPAAGKWLEIKGRLQSRPVVYDPDHPGELGMWLSDIQILTRPSDNAELNKVRTVSLSWNEIGLPCNFRADFLSRYCGKLVRVGGPYSSGNHWITSDGAMGLCVVTIMEIE